MKAEDLMTRRVICVRPESEVIDAAKLMLQDDIAGLPVINKEHELVGIITESDFLRRAEVGTDHYPQKWQHFLVHPGTLADQYVHSHGRKVGDVMTRDVTTVSADTPIAAIVSVMEKKRFKRLPVVEGRRVIGIITRADIMRAIIPVLGGGRGTPGDPAIQEQIEKDLAKEGWDITGLHVVVEKGAASVFGFLPHEDLRRAVKALIENVPGVSKFDDHLKVRAPSSRQRKPFARMRPHALVKGRNSFA